ncbi:MAG: YceI family protein [Acidimicrobiales bacterium]
MTTLSPTSTYSPEITGDYQFDLTHSRLGFVARHAMVSKVRGSFKTFDGSLHLDATDPAKSSVNVTIDVASVDTGVDQRDEHLRNNDFFDAPTFPQITFAGTKIEPTGVNSFDVTGDLTIRGVTKPVTLEIEFTGAAKDPYGNERIGFEGTTVLNRSDFGVSFNAVLEAGGVMVSDKITIELDIEAVKSA